MVAFRYRLTQVVLINGSYMSMLFVMLPLYALLALNDNPITCLVMYVMKKKRSEEMQTLRAGCSKAEPKTSPRRRPTSRGCRVAKI